MTGQVKPLSQRIDQWIEGVALVCDGGVPLNGPALTALLMECRELAKRHEEYAAALRAIGTGSSLT